MKDPVRCCPPIIFDIPPVALISTTQDVVKTNEILREGKFFNRLR